jgi:hypothetical protein
MARVCSYLLPGTGQLLSGDYRNFVNSFLLVGGLAAAAIAQSIIASPLDALYVVGPWLFRYYSGGVTLAYSAAAQNREARQARSLQELLLMMKK